VGVSLCVTDDQAVGRNSQRDAKRADAYSAWLEAAKGDDFIGVQNYERTRLDAQGMIAPPEDAPRNQLGGEIYAPSLEGAVRYVHEVTGTPIIVTEHGVSTPDDTVRAEFIPAALKGLKAAMDDGVRVGGYIHWSLLDNFEWSFGFRPKFGLVAVDRATFERTPKPSAHVLGAIARRNSL
jgi:beta-glucosidase